MNRIFKQRIFETVIKCLEEYSCTGDDFVFDEQDFGDEKNINVCVNGDELGYIILIPHRNIESLYSEIAETDSYEMAEDVISKLNRNKQIIEIADVDVNKKYRNRGVSKMLIEYTLEKYKEYQFYLRVCPTDGVDEETFAKTFKRYGFIEIDRSENGTFMVKK